MQTTVKFKKTTSKYEDNHIGDKNSHSTFTLEKPDATVGQGDLPVQRLELNWDAQQIEEEHVART